MNTIFVYSNIYFEFNLKGNFPQNKNADWLSEKQVDKPNSKSRRKCA